jgi:hypothetical protein
MTAVWKITFFCELCVRDVDDQVQGIEEPISSDDKKRYLEQLRYRHFRVHHLHCKRDPFAARYGQKQHST